MKKINLILILFVIIFQGCNNDDCGNCFKTPRVLTLEIVNKTSGENLFTNGTFEPENIVITNNLNNNETIEFSFISENDINLIHISSIDWESEIMNLKIDFSDSQIFEFYTYSEIKMGDCCSYIEYNKITFANAEFKLDTETGIYKVFIG